MTAWEKLRFNQVTTLEKVIQDKIGFTTLRSVIGQKKTLAALWLVKKKTLAALLTNQMQNWNKSWSFHVLPWFLVGCLLYLNFLDWMLWIPSLGFVALEWKEFFSFFWRYDFLGSLRFHDFTNERHFKVLFRLTFSRFTVFLVVHLFCEHRGSATTVTNLPCVTLFTRLQFV